MDSLHSVMRSLRLAPKRKNDRKRDHLTVFREFLSHLDRVSKQHVVRDVKAARKPRARKAKG
jgi:ABC-type ATPase with predicted acetyltransferase domain